MRRVAVIGAMLAAILGTASPASAQLPEIPTGCTADRLGYDIIADRVTFRDGDTINFTVELENEGASGCDVGNVSLSFRYPGPDGTASGKIERLTTAARYAHGTRGVSFGPFAHVAVVDEGVPGLVANVSGAPGAFLYDTLRTPLNIFKNISVRRTAPALTIDKTGSIATGVAPQNVTYTYVVTNTSTTPVPMREIKVTDDLCANATYLSGDNGDRLLSNGEKWTFTCTTLHQAPGVYTNTAYACAISNVDNRDVCSPPDKWTVTLTPPPPPPPPPAPDSGVLPASATQAPCDIQSPKNLKVRAKERTTIRVTVRNVDAGSRATITLPGGKKVSAKTNSKGVATFKVTPPKSGKATIRMADCGDVARFTVRKPRQVQSRRVPRVTG
jgi:uncharacterized repeat protein (TIGR01451 family)